VSEVNAAKQRTYQHTSCANTSNTQLDLAAHSATMTSLLAKPLQSITGWAMLGKQGPPGVQHSALPAEPAGSGFAEMQAQPLDPYNQWRLQKQALSKSMQRQPGHQHQPALGDGEADRGSLVPPGWGGQHNPTKCHAADREGAMGAGQQQAGYLGSIVAPLVVNMHDCHVKHKYLDQLCSVDVSTKLTGRAGVRVGWGQGVLRVLWITAR
jgi:hypothetical protein